MRLRLVLSPLVLTCILGAICQAQTPPPQPKFSVEIPGMGGSPPAYVTLAGKEVSSLLSEGNLRRIAGGDPNRRPPSALKLVFKIQGDSVLITASVFYGDFDRSRTPASLDNLPQETVGSYSGKLNDSVQLSEMERFGLEPLTLKILTAQPQSSVRPQTLTKAPSVQMEIVGEDRTFYKVALRNLSAKSVTALRVDMPENVGGTGQTADSGPPKALIAPGAAYEFGFAIPHSTTIVNGRHVENPLPPFLTLEAVLFDDGSYEGDLQAAAELTAHRVGADAQRQRIHRLVDAILSDPQPDDDARIKRFQSDVAQLTEDPDPPLVESTTSQFPGLSGQALEKVRTSLQSALHIEKEIMARALEDFELAKSNPRHLTLAAWWGAWQKR